MRHHTVAVFGIALGVFSLAEVARSAEPNGQSADPFALSGTSNILDEAHFGIVNGKLTCGIPYRNVFGVDGLWAPPYVSSDFKLDITVKGQPIITNRYTWHPFW